MQRGFNNNYGFSPYQGQNRNNANQRSQFVQGYKSNNAGYNLNAPKKHSGCKAGQDKNGKPYVQGWKYDKRFGLRSFFAAPYKGTGKHKSGAGIEWQNWMVKIQQTGQKEQIVSGLYDPTKKKVSIAELQYVMSPKGGRGGYVGPYIQRK